MSSDVNLGQNHRKKRRMTATQLANLRPAWQPGTSGNASGCPKGTTKLSIAYQKVLAMDPKERVKPKTRAEQVAQSIVARAEKGDVRAAAEIADRTEGKATQRIDMQESIETRERECQVRFLSHTIRTIAPDGTNIEEVWKVIEQRELELFNEDVRHLRPAVLAALGVGDEKAD